MARRLPGYAATFAVAALLIAFIAVPLGAVLTESLVIARPMALAELGEMTTAALAKLDAADRERSVARWIERPKPEQRIEAIAAALTLIGQPGNWDSKAPFDEQIVAAEAALERLAPAARAAFDAEYPLAMIMLHKRIPLAFKIKARLSEAEFDRLRTGSHAGLGLDHYLAVVKEPRLRHAAANSLMLAALACLITTTLAYAIAYGVNRGGVPWPNLVRYGTLIPLVSPPVIIATAAVLLFGRQGAITKSVLDQALGWINADEQNLYGLAGVVIAQVLSFLPPAYIIMDNVLSRHDGRVEEAAASLGASPRQVFWRVTLPLSQPGIIRAAILCVVLSMTDFGNPLVIGRDMPVLAGVIYDEIVGFHNTGISAAIAVWIIVPALALYFLIERFGHRKRYDTGAASSGPPELAVPLPARVVLTAVAAAVIALVAVLYGTVVVGAFVRLWGIDNAFTLSHFTDAESGALTNEWRGVSTVWQSLKVALVAAPLGGLLALAVAYIVERIRPVGANLISFISLLPAVLPGVIFGIGYIIAFNLPFGVKQLALTGTLGILVLNILFGNLFVGVLAGRASLQRLDSAVDEAAEILGASLTQRFWRIILPMMRRAALLGALYVFVDGMTTLSSVVFLVGPAHKLASVAIFDTASKSYYGAACAMSVTILVIVFGVMGALWAFEKHGPAWMRIDLQAAPRRRAAAAGPGK
jgi:iron(III) transport system permease protein